MKKRMACGSLAALAFGSGLALAGPVVGPTSGLFGSDTLDTLVDTVISQCAGVDFAYTGGGSTAGERAMTPTGNIAPAGAEQAVAPMSRKLGARACELTSVGGGAGRAAQNAAIAMDALSVVAGDVSCGGNADNAGVAGRGVTFPVTDRDGVAGVDCSTCSGGVYTLDSFRDALRIIYAGAEKDDGSTQASYNCNSDVRRSLIAQWSTLITGCTGSSCSGALEHAWRRGDLSGTTDTFLSLLGLPAVTVAAAGNVTATPFCNGTDFEDLDPVRTACVNAEDQVCGRILCTPGTDPSDPANTCSGADRTLGVLQPVFVPTNAAAVATRYPTQACTNGRFEFQRVPRNPKRRQPERMCPDGTQPTFGLCLAPTTATGDFNCTSAANNLSALANALPAASRPNGRSYNKVVRTGNAIAGTGATLRDEFNNEVLGAYYRMASACSEDSSTTQIGCLVSKRTCEIGFAATDAARSYGSDAAEALAVGGVAPAIDTVQAGTYPLARKLYFNTLYGFTNVVTQPFAGTVPDPRTAGEAALTQCMLGIGAGDATPDFTAALGAGITAAGFFPLPGSGAPQIASLGGAPGETCCDGTQCTSGSCTSNVCRCTADAQCAGIETGADCLPSGLCGCDADSDCPSSGTACRAGVCVR